MYFLQKKKFKIDIKSILTETFLMIILIFLQILFKTGAFQFF